MTLLLGIASGLGAAVSQSITYLYMRHYVEKRVAAGHGQAGNQLIVLGHVWMGLFAAIMSAFLWPPEVPWRAIALPLVGNMAGYALGLFAQVIALRHAEASRVGPLFTAKLIVSSILVMLFGMQTGGATGNITLLQWIAIPICVIAGISINFTGGKMSAKVLPAIALAAVGFAVSDYCITVMLKQTLAIPAFAGSPFKASIFGGLLSYLVAGAVSLALLPKLGSRKIGDWMEAVPFAVFWLGGMMGLYTAFSLVGILLGQILQCTRGFITIVFGAVVMRMGHHHIEPKVPRRVVMQRLAAGVVMFLGICLYVLKDQETVQKMLNQARGIKAEAATIPANDPAHPIK